MKSEEIKKAVKAGYAKVALLNVSCCGTGSSCCGSAKPAEDISRKVGYGDEDLKSAPDGANLGLGCGNPVALASLEEGETVLDLGSGAGFDCFLAASKVGSKGRVIGVDMTREMIEKARRNAREGNFANVEFRFGEIEALPVSESDVDVVISNCVINLSPDKNKVFQEAFRVLRPDGRLMVADMVLLKALPEAVQKSVAAYVGCIAGASMKKDYLAAIEAAGFEAIQVLGEDIYPIEWTVADPVAQEVREGLDLSAEEAADLAASVVSIKVLARKPNPSN